MNMVEEYVNASKSQYRDAFDIIEEFKKEMSEMRGKCIDIGCGPGDVTKKLILPRLSLEAELVGKGTGRKGWLKYGPDIANVCRGRHIEGDDRLREAEVPGRETFVVLAIGHRNLGFT